MKHLHFGGFKSIVEDLREAGDTGVIHLHFSGFMLIVEGQGEAGDTRNDTTSFWLVSVDWRGPERSWRQS